MSASITRQRLASQQVAHPRLTSAAALVQWMGAVQAQDFRGSLWAVGLRMATAVEAEVEQAIADRTIVRTWPMRGTLHYAPAADVRWMLELLTPPVIARSAGRYRELGLDEAAFKRGGKILTRALAGGRSLTRAGVYDALQRGGVSPEGQRGIHIVGHLAQRGLLCHGPRRDKQPTFVLLDERLPAPRKTAREEALATLAQRYFASHGPATLHDFAWWSGLSIKEAQAAIADAGSKLTGETVEGRRWLRAGRTPPVRPTRGPVAVLLPVWDEYVVAYKYRDHAVDHPTAREARLKTVGSALIVVDGTVRGGWRRSLSPTAVEVALQFWTAPTAPERRAVEKAVARYAEFLGLKPLIVGISR